MATSATDNQHWESGGAHVSSVFTDVLEVASKMLRIWTVPYPSLWCLHYYLWGPLILQASKGLSKSLSPRSFPSVIKCCSQASVQLKAGSFSALWLL